MKAILGTRFVKALKARANPYEVNDSNLPGFLVRVQPSGVKTYYAVYHLRGKRQNRIRLGRGNVISANEARKQAQTVLGDAARGFDPKEDERLVPAHTLLGFIDDVYGPWVVTDQKTGWRRLPPVLVYLPCGQ